MNAARSARMRQTVVYEIRQFHRAVTNVEYQHNVVTLDECFEILDEYKVNLDAYKAKLDEYKAKLAEYHYALDKNPVLLDGKHLVEVAFLLISSNTI